MLFQTLTTTTPANEPPERIRIRMHFSEDIRRAVEEVTRPPAEPADRLRTAARIATDPYAFD